MRAFKTQIRDESHEKHRIARNGERSGMDMDVYPSAVIRKIHKLARIVRACACRAKAEFVTWSCYSTAADLRFTLFSSLKRSLSEVSTTVVSLASVVRQVSSVLVN